MGGIRPKCESSALVSDTSNVHRDAQMLLCCATVARMSQLNTTEKK